MKQLGYLAAAGKPMSSFSSSGCLRCFGLLPSGRCSYLIR